jgi:hypothetical protein
MLVSGQRRRDARNSRQVCERRRNREGEGQSAELP